MICRPSSRRRPLRVKGFILPVVGIKMGSSLLRTFSLTLAKNDHLLPVWIAQHIAYHP